jgi:hypothetical protein
MDKRASIAFIAFAVIIAATNLNATTGTFCGFLYPQGAPGSGILPNGVNTALINSSTYTYTLALSLLVIIMVMMVLGLVYAIGQAFQIGKLLDYSKNEFLESIFNVVLVLLILNGTLVGDNLIIKGSQISMSALAATTGAANLNVPPVTSPIGMYTSLCNNYMSSLGALAGNYALLSSIGTLVLFATTAPVNLPNPSAFTFITVNVFNGLSTLGGLISVVLGILSFIIGLHIMIVLILFVIYYLFPLFLYLGILFRSFPWTRPAGGAFLSLFLAFNVVLPIILYPFSYASSIAQSSAESAIPTSSGLSAVHQIFVYAFGSGILQFTASQVLKRLFTVFFANLPLGLGAVSPPSLLLALFPHFIITVGIYLTTFSMFEVIGFIVAFLVSYETLEALSDLLGAPALTATNRATGLLKGIR